MKSQNKFYVYAILDTRKSGTYKYEDYNFNFEPIYIGKGSDNRLIAHLREQYMKYNYNKFLNNKIRAIRAETGHDPIVIKIKENLYESEAFQLEIFLIELIKRKIDNGPLTNIYAGGEGPSKSPEVRKKISETKKLQYKNGLVHPMLGKKRKPSTVLLMKNRKPYKWNAEQKSRLKIIRNKIKPNNTCKWKVIDPQGVEYIVWGLGEFCRNNGLCQGHLFSVAAGHRKHHKGWTCSKITA